MDFVTVARAQFVEARADPVEAVGRDGQGLGGGGFQRFGFLANRGLFSWASRRIGASLFGAEGVRATRDNQGSGDQNDGERGRSRDDKVRSLDIRSSAQPFKCRLDEPCGVAGCFSQTLSGWRSISRPL